MEEKERGQLSIKCEFLRCCVCLLSVFLFVFLFALQYSEYVVTLKKDP